MTFDQSEESQSGQYDAGQHGSTDGNSTLHYEEPDHTSIHRIPRGTDLFTSFVKCFDEQKTLSAPYPKTLDDAIAIPGHDLGNSGAIQTEQ